MHDDRHMFFGALNEQDWIPERQWNRKAHGIDRDMSAVLTVASSLTRFLERRYHMQLQVVLQEQSMDRMAPDEAALLHGDPNASVLRRRVSLTHRGKTVFDAESVLPLEPLPQSLILELQEGERPLANLLMDYGLSLSRLDLGIARIRSQTPWQGCWARRSVLRSGAGIQALVVEVFQPLMWQRLRAMQRHGGAFDRVD